MSYLELVNSISYSTTRWSYAYTTEHNVKIAWIRRGTVLDIYVNGELYSSAAIGSIGTFTGASAVINSVSPYYPSMEVALIGCSADRALDGVLLTENPWSIYAPRTLSIPVSAGGATVDLAADSNAHAHTSDNLALTLSTTLAIVNSAHAHTSDSPVLSTDTALTIASAAHAHASDNVTLSIVSAGDLVVQDSTHAHTSAAPTLTTDSTLAVDGAGHGHTSESPTLSLVAGVDLVVQDASHAHTATSPALTTAPTLVAQAAAHAHTSEAPALTLETWLVAADSWHVHTSDAPTLDGESCSVGSTGPMERGAYFQMMLRAALL